MDNYKIVTSRFPRDAAGFIRSFHGGLEPGTRLRVYAVGGDGIIFDCLNGMMGLDNTELAVIPYGHTNNFIRGFGKRAKSLFRDITLQYTAPVMPLDVIRTGDTYALNHCTIGVESLAAYHAIRMQDTLDEGGAVCQWLKRRFYTWLYYLGGIKACLNKEVLWQNYEVTIDGVDYSGSYRSFHIGNGCWYGGKLHPVESAVPDDGELDVLLAAKAGIFKSLRLISAFLRGKYHRYPAEFILKKGRKISIRSGNPLYISFDDIIFLDYSLTVEVLPGAINFVDVTKHGYLGFSEQGGA